MGSKTVLTGTEELEWYLMAVTHSKIVSVGRVEPRASRMNNCVLKNILV